MEHRLTSALPIVKSSGERTHLKASERTAIEVEKARQRAEEGRLRLPAFEWYLGPMYRRYGEILAERARANTTEVEKKKKTYSVQPDPPWMKHVKPRPSCHRFCDAVHERPLDQHTRAHIATGSTKGAKKDGTGGQTPRLKDATGPVARPKEGGGSATARSRQDEVPTMR